MTYSRISLLLAVLWLPGCATIVQGANQNLTVTTNPSGAACRLERDGSAIGVIAPTPGTLRINRDKKVIAVTCTRDGHDPTTAHLASEFGGATFGNIIVGGLIGVVVDASSGANFLYPPELVMNLQVTGGPPVVQPVQPTSRTTADGAVVPTNTPGTAAPPVAKP